MTLKDMIYKRKSCRNFSKKPLSEETLEAIENFGETLKPLDESFKTQFAIVDSKKIAMFMPWRAPHYMAIFSERKPGYGVNVGFMFQQMDLYLQSKGLGCCWVGMAMLAPGKKKEFEFLSYDPEIAEVEQMPFVIILAFGNSTKCRSRNVNDFSRKTPSEIADYVDAKLEPARFAPSARNGQPWYFTHNNDCFDVYFTKPRAPGKLNQIDIGIALAHIYVSNHESFEFFTANNPAKLPGKYYIGSFKI